MREEFSRVLGVALAMALFVQIGCVRNSQEGSTFHSVKMEAQSKALSPELAGATALYEKGDYINSTLILTKVIDSGATAAEKQQAEFTMAKALYRMGMPSAAFSRFEEIGRQGESHGYYTASLSWLAAVLSELPADSELQQVLDAYPISIIDDPQMAAARDDLRVLFGQRLYHSGKLSAAAKQFAAVSAKSPRFAMARILEGVTHVRRRDARAARAAFQAAHTATGDHAERYVDGERLHRLAALQLARVAYSVGEYDEAIELYDSLPQYSAEWRDGLFEASWAHLLGNTRRAKALGNIYSLGTAHIEPGLYPEAKVLEALIHFERCQYSVAISSAKQSRNELKPQRLALEQLLKVDVDAELYAAAREQIGAVGPIGRALDDRAIRRALAWIDAIEAQSQRVAAQDPSWTGTEIGIDTEQRLALQLSFAEAEAGRMIRTRLQRSQRELRRLSNDSSRIEIESLERLATAKKKRSMGIKTVASGKLESVPTDDEHYVWRDGNVWSDEVGSVYAPIRNMCPAKTAQK